MANQERGEVGIEVEGKAYTLRPWFNALCELETLTGGKTYEDLFVEIQAGRLTGLRAAVWCLLQCYHKDEIKTLEDAGNWVDRAGLDRVFAALAGVTEANEEPVEAVGGAPPANPRKARAVGTGGRSSLRRVRSA